MEDLLLAAQNRLVSSPLGSIGLNSQPQTWVLSFFLDAQLVVDRVISHVLTLVWPLPLPCLSLLFSQPLQYLHFLTLSALLPHPYIHTAF